MTACFKALVVDDEPTIRRLLRRVLTSQGGDVVDAADGNEALRLWKQGAFDLVVTDLQMPNRNGHSLAVEVLSSGPSRPLVVVLTGVLEPRLADDLIARGVDDIHFKPLDFAAFGARMRYLVARRRAERSRGPAPADSGDSSWTSQPAGELPLLKLDPDAVQRRLDQAQGILPLSGTAVEVLNLVESGTTDADRLAAHIARDASLAGELLKLANSSFYNRGLGQVDDLRTAVVRLGFRRVAESAVAALALNAVTSRALPWMNVRLAWRRSMGVGVALELLNTDATLGGRSEGLFLAGLMEPLGRVLLGSLFPDEYERAVACCRESLIPLAAAEQWMFSASPQSHLAHVLYSWRLPRNVVRPLEHLGRSFAEAMSLSDPLRGKVEMVKFAALLAHFAVAEWDELDSFDLPDPATLIRLRPENIDDHIQEVASSLGPLTALAVGGARESPPPIPPESARRPVAYCNRSFEHDFLARLMRLFGYEPAPLDTAEAVGAGSVLWNLSGVSCERLPAAVATSGLGSGACIVTGARHAAEFAPYGATLVLPASIGRLKRELDTLAAAPRTRDDGPRPADHGQFASAPSCGYAMPHADS